MCIKGVISKSTDSCIFPKISAKFVNLSLNSLIWFFVIIVFVHLVCQVNFRNSMFIKNCFKKSHLIIKKGHLLMFSLPGFCCKTPYISWCLLYLPGNSPLGLRGYYPRLQSSVISQIKQNSQLSGCAFVCVCVCVWLTADCSCKE